MWCRATAFALTFAFPLGTPHAHAAVRERPSPAARSSLTAARETLGRFGECFLENRGQAHPDVLFYGGHVSFTKRGIVIAVAEREPNPKERAPAERVAIEFVGANPDVRPVGRKQIDTAVSVFRGAPDEWRTGVARFEEICYPNLWPGVDLVARSAAESPLKYELVAAPGADPSRVRLAYLSAAGADLTASGDVEIRAASGLMRERAPVSFQETERGRVPVASAFRRAGGSRGLEVGFDVGPYDPTRPLVIDPEIVFSGLIAGKGVENAADVALDSSGNIYLAGSTTSPPSDGFPVVGGPGGTFYASEGQDIEAFVAKISADGSRIVYAGYIGGERIDYATGVAVDGAGNAYVYGTTYSNAETEHFPALVGPSLLLNGNESRNPDAFISKVSADGSHLVYSGYITAPFAEDSTDVAVDAQGNAFLVGNFPRAASPTFADRPLYDPCQNANAETNGFVVKVAADGSRILWQNWIIGSGVETILGVAVDSAGVPYVTGYTTSQSLCYVTKGPKLTPGGKSDAFVGKLTPDGKSFQYLGFIGGADDDIGTRIAVDASGAAYVVGMAKSTESSFPVTVGPGLTHSGPAGTFDGFVAKVKPDGTGLVYCGYLGGSADDASTSVAVDSKGRAFVAGFTASADFPTVNAVDDTYAGGGTIGDGFVSEVAANGKSLEFSTFLGGTAADAGMAVALDPQGNPVVVGITESQDGSFPTTANAFNATPMGLSDVFVVKLRVGPAGPRPPSISSVAKEGKFLVVTGANFVKGAMVLVNGTAYKAKPDPANPTSVLKSKKAGKVVKAGDTVTVRNPDGGTSNAITFAG